MNMKSDLARAEIAKYKKMRTATDVVNERLKTHKIEGTSIQPTLDFEDMKALASAGFVQQAPQSSLFDGNKFFGGFGPTQMFTTDYWELRAKSSQLFKENLYARGIIRRFITNVINTGLFPEAMPEESILGLPEDSLDDWTEDVENRFYLWATNPEVCDFNGLNVFSKQQQIAKLEAYVAGDVLVLIHINNKTKMPYIELINGSKVQTSYDDKSANIAKSHTVRHGVERNRAGRHVAYWIRQDDGTSKRIPRTGRNGRRIAFLLYGTDKRMDEVRGEPLLSIILQSLKEIDRYRDAALRKAVVSSMLALVVTQSEDSLPTKPISGGAIRKDSASVTQGDGTAKDYNVGNNIPGWCIDSLGKGEDIKAFSSDGTDVDFQKFEEAMVAAMAWALETPPEIMRLAFSSNYAASQAANNEYKIFLNKERQATGHEFCDPIYSIWLIAEVMRGRIKANGLLEAWRDPNEYEKYGAWIASDWSGAIKPSTDIVKTAKGMQINVEQNFISLQRACREVSGQKLSKVLKANAKAGKAIAEDMAARALPMLELKKKFADVAVDTGNDDMNAAIEAIFESKLDDMVESTVEATVELLAQDA